MALLATASQGAQHAATTSHSGSGLHILCASTHGLWPQTPTWLRLAQQSSSTELHAWAGGGTGGGGWGGQGTADEGRPWSGGSGTCCTRPGCVAWCRRRSTPAMHLHLHAQTSPARPTLWKTARGEQPTSQHIEHSGGEAHVARQVGLNHACRVAGCNTSFRTGL